MKFIKKSVSVFLALLMIFGSVSMLANAADALYNWTSETKFYRMQRNADGYICDAAGNAIADENDVLIEGAEPVWVETTKAKKGESVKARVFMGTDYQSGTLNILYFYPKDALVFDPSNHSKGDTPTNYALIINPKYVEANSFAGTFSQATEGGLFDIELDNTAEGFGRVTEADIEGNGYIFTSVKALNNTYQLDANDWFYEFYFKTTEDSSALGQLYIEENAIADYDYYYTSTVVTANPDNDGVNTNVVFSCDEDLGTFGYTLYDTDTDSTLGTKSSIVFDANGGKFKDGSTSKVISGDVDPFTAITASVPADPEKDGENFAGWVLSSNVATVADGDATVAAENMRFGYKDVTYKATYEPADATYVLNTYTQGLDGQYVLNTTYPAGTVGDTVTYAEEDPAGFTMDKNLSKPLSVIVTGKNDNGDSDDTDIINVYYNRNKYDIVFDGVTADDAKSKYYEATYTAPAGPDKEGYTFTGWQAGDVVLQAGETATVGTENVKYTATYAPAANTVNVAINYVDQVTKEAKTVYYPVATTTENTVAIVDKMPETPDENTTYVLLSDLTAINHYEYTADGASLTATVNGDGTTTPVLSVNYVPVKYTATFTGADTFADQPYYTTITVPAGPKVAGQTFKGWSTDGATVAYTAGQTFNIESDVTYTAIYEATKYNVTYTFAGKDNDDSNIPAIDAPEATTGVMGDEVVLPEQSADGYTFLGWETTGDVNGNIGEADVAVVGTWIKNTYTINYWLDDEMTNSWSEATYVFGDEIIAPEDPTDDYLEAGTYFDGWSLDASVTTIDKETQDTYFTETEDGVWVLDVVAMVADYEYTVEVYFMNAVGEEYATAQATMEGLFYGDTIEAVDMPDTNIDGHEFVNWKVGAREITFPYTVTGNTRINGYFNALPYTATFDAAGGAWLDGDTSKDLEFLYGAQITEPIERPVREGYTFAMWDPELSVMTSDGAYFEAFWTANKYEITFDVEGVKTTSEQTFGKKITVPAEVVTDKSGYTFKGWTADGGLNVIADITTVDVPAKATTYVAVFEAGDVDYTVNRYLMNLDGTYAGVTPEVITGLKAEADTQVTYNAAIEGFTLDTNLGNITDTVKGDGTTVINAYYSRNKYDVTYVAQGSTVDTEKVYFGADLTASKAYTAAPAGYNFLGWSRVENATAADASLGTMDSVNGVTLYAVLDPIEYNATFIIAAEDSEATYTTVEVSYMDAITAPTAPTTEVPAGYKFVGWATTKGATEALADLGKMDTVGGKTFYAVLTSDSTVAYKIEKYFMGLDGKTYTLDATKTEIKADGVAGAEKTVTATEYEGFTFDSDNTNNVVTAMVKGDGTTVFVLYYDRNTATVTVDGKTEIVKYYGSELTAAEMPEYAAAEAGMKATGWAYADNTAVSFPVKIGTADIAIKTAFGPADFAITFTANGTAVQTGDQTFGEILAVPGTEPTLAGHTFDGWYDAQGNKVVAGTTTVPAAATTYTAKFIPDNYTVTFMAEGSQVATGEYAFGTAVVVPAYTAPAGYSFKGWSTDGVTVLDMSKETVPVNGVTYFAVIEAGQVEYTVETYVQKFAEGDYEMTSETLYATADAPVNVVPDPQTGFKVDTAASVLNGVAAGDGSTVLKVYYNRNKYDVVLNGVTAEYYYGASVELGEAVAPAGYEFTKWVDADGADVASPFIVPAKDTIIDPVFTALKYTVKFLVNGQNYVEPVELDFGTEISAPATKPSIAGYTFEGWSTDGKNVIVDLGTVAVGGNTFIAVLTAKSGIEYTVNKIYQTVDGSAWGEAVPDVRTGTAGQLITIDEAAEAEEGFTIESYDPASAKINGDGSTVFNIYYARNTYSISIDGIAENVYYGSEINRDAPTKAGYTFEGWFDAEGNEVTLPLIVTKDIVITSKLTPNTVSLSFEVDGAVVEGYPTTAKVDSAITAPESPVKEGYSFVGWFIKETSTMFSGTMPATDTVYEAKWIEGDHTQYALEIYMMDTEGEYTLSTIQYGYGKTGSPISVVPSSWVGFTYDPSISVLEGTITADGTTALKIYYARDKYTVTWNVDGVKTTDEVCYGAAIIAPEAPSKTGFAFAGWTPAVAATMPANNVEYTATWTAVDYTITYVVNGDKYTETYNAGANVTVKDAPAVEGMKFLGWFDGNTEYVAGSTFTMPAENLIIVADFAVGVFKVSYLDANGGEFEKIMVRFGDAIPVPASQPTKEFHTFKGWDIPYDTMPSNDITVTPIFERISVKLIPMAGSTTVIDRDNNVIYGLQEYLNEDTLRNSYLDVEGDGYFTVIPVQTGYYGTGAKVELYDNLDTSAPVETYTIVVFGDINGDSLVEAIDSIYADDEDLMITNWSSETVYDKELGSVVENVNYDPYKTMAADLNGDGMIDATDASLIGDATIGLFTINQVTGRAS